MDVFKLDMIFARSLEAIRKERNLSRDEFANELNISPRALQRYESGVRLPSSKKIEEMAALLNIEPEDFFVTEKILKQRVTGVVSIFAKKILNVPDQVYYLAEQVGPLHEAWKSVEVVLKHAIENDAEKSKSKNGYKKK
jgi:transcriptional regulator with XRE-family HTH domain